MDSAKGRIKIFVSFDLEHDRDLCDLLIEQSKKPGRGFDVIGQSAARGAEFPPSESARREIKKADEIIVICGTHTEDSVRMSAELRVVQEELKPYFLLWGRRESMCTKPQSAKSDEGMYSWTSGILRSQMQLTLRNAENAIKEARASKEAKGGGARVA